VYGSFCAGDLKRAVSAVQCGEGQRERYDEEKRMPDEVTEEGGEPCYMRVSPNTVYLFCICFYIKPVDQCLLTHLYDAAGK
jgi:hypothetical protein